MSKLIDYTTGDAKEYIRILDILSLNIAAKVTVKVLGRKTVSFDEAEREYTLIYKRLDEIKIENNEIDLSNTFIDNSNLDKISKINYKDIPIKSNNGFYYGNGMFLSKDLVKVDFSNSNFFGDNFEFEKIEGNFDNVTMLCKKAKFHNVHIENLTFNNSSLIADSFEISDFTLTNKLTFSKSKLRANDFIIKKGRINKGGIEFSHLNVQVNKFDINNIEIADGYIEFNKTYFKNCSLNLEKINLSAKQKNIKSGLDFIGCSFDISQLKVTNSKFVNLIEEKHKQLFDMEKTNFVKSTFIMLFVDFIKCVVHLRYITLENCTNELIELNCQDTSLEYSDFKCKDTDISLLNIKGFSNFVLRKVNMQAGSFSMSALDSPKKSIIFQKNNFESGLQVNKSDFSPVFNNCKFSTNLLFEENIMDKIHFNKCKFFSFVNINNKYGAELYVDDCIINNVFDIRQMSYNGRDAIYRTYDRLSFHKTVNLGRIELDYKKNNVYESMLNNFNKLCTIREDDIDDILYDLVEQFRMLKENYNKTGKYDDEDNAYLAFCKHLLNNLKTDVGFKDQKYRFNQKTKLNFIEKIASLIVATPLYLYNAIKIIILNRNKKDNLLASMRVWGLSFLDDIGSYAIDPFKIVKSIISVQVFFIVSYLILFSIFRYNYEDMIIFDIIRLPLKSTYFSLITFFTVGFGDISQATFNESIPIKYMVAFLSSIEAFLGVFLMGYFSVSIVRKTLR